MKKHSIIVGFFLLTSCNQPTQTRDVHHPARPSDIPATTCSGMEVEWNWEKQRAYNDGRLWLHKDSSGCLLAIVWKKD